MRKSLALTFATMTAAGTLVTAVPASAQPAGASTVGRVAPSTITTAGTTEAAASTAAEPEAAEVSAAGLRQLYRWNFQIRPGSSMPKGSDKRAWKVLHNCFNCVFPIKGAPKKFPKDGQRINLKACVGGNWGCKKAPVKYYHGMAKYGWYFIAQSGHFDGAGSRVYFTIYMKGKLLFLGVRGYVKHPTIPDAVNKHFANATWSKFATRLGSKLR
ncbi:hypothetical protein GCM10029978_003350 [Actinoallomurus acanthiterrae]